MIFTKFLDFEGSKNCFGKSHLLFIFLWLTAYLLQFLGLFEAPWMSWAQKYKWIEKYVILEHFWYFMSNIWISKWILEFSAQKESSPHFFEFDRCFFAFLGSTITNTKYFSLSSSKNMKQSIRITLEMTSPVFFA